MLKGVPSISSLPGGIVLKNCLLTLPSSNLPVDLTKETDLDITIPQRCVIGEIHALGSVLSSDAVVSKSTSPGSEHTAVKEEMFTLNFLRYHRIGEIQSLRSFVRCQRYLVNTIWILDTQKVKHCIKLHDKTPFKHRARPIHPQDTGAVRKQLQELLSSEVICESESPLSSLMVVRKKNGDVRFFIDYQKLNLQIFKDAYALPNLEETFSDLNGLKWFSVLDLKPGYNQIEVAEEDKPKTAFVFPWGFVNLTVCTRG